VAHNFALEPNRVRDRGQKHEQDQGDLDDGHDNEESDAQLAAFD
jgi:hypothetical protein